MGEDLSIVMSQLEINKPDQLDGIEPFSEDSSTISVKNNNSRSLRKRSLSSYSSSSDLSSLSLHKTRNRKIQKPKKLETESQIKNFYINVNKKVKLKPILLETIYEAEEETSDNDIPGEPEKRKNIGLKKIKRQIVLNDGLNATKSLKDKRKNQIKKYLGSRKKPKKIATEKFMHIFQSLISSGDIVGQDVTVPCKGKFFLLKFQSFLCKLYVEVALFL
jgi:hypothetical protein